jgi:hypothetical protein
MSDTQANILQIIADRSQELSLASRTAAELVRYVNLALQQIPLDHDFEETRTSTDLSFTRSSTLSYASVSKPADFWAPIELNNADNDYKFWYCRPDLLKNLDRGDRYVPHDIEDAFAKDGSNLLIYHDKTETLTLKYYSFYLVNDVSAGTTRVDFAAADTTDTFVLRNDDILITRTLMYLMEKEPNSDNQYAKLAAYYENLIKAEKLHYPSQRLESIEELIFVG